MVLGGGERSDRLAGAWMRAVGWARGGPAREGGWVEGARTGMVGGWVGVREVEGRQVVVLGGASSLARALRS